MFSACMRQEVVVLGSGAFACEAMEAALARGAKHVTMVCRDRKRRAPGTLAPHACILIALRLPPGRLSIAYMLDPMLQLLPCACPAKGRHHAASFQPAGKQLAGLRILLRTQVDPALQPGADAGRAGASAAHPLALEDGADALVAQALLLRARGPCAHDARRRQQSAPARQ